MTDQTNPTESTGDADPCCPPLTDAQADALLDDIRYGRGLSSFDGATAVVAEAVHRGIVATRPYRVGDFGVAFRNSEGRVEVIDVRQHELEPRLLSFRQHDAKFVGVMSLAEYVNRYQTPATIAYITDVYGRGLTMLTTDTTVVDTVIDDHDASGDDVHVGRRAHHARLVLRPTAAARRWGAALSSPRGLDQESFLDLVVDGIGEIATPDGADLRELIGDLHAIRSTEVKSVIRTGGEGAIQVAENVKLHAGTGNTVTFPEEMTIILTPFAGVAGQIVLAVRIKPTVHADRVSFALTAPELDDKLAAVMSDIAGHITEATGLRPLWVP